MSYHGNILLDNDLEEDILEFLVLDEMNDILLRVEFLTISVTPMKDIMKQKLY